VLELIDESLEAFFRAFVPLSATDVDVSFEPPDREWSSKLTRPTVNLFLWDIRRSSDRSKTGMRTVQRNGVAFHETPRPVLELRYVVTAWTSIHADERALLAGLVRSLLAQGAIPRDFLPDVFADMDAPVLTMARAGEEHVDVFKALEGQLKPGLNMVVTTEFDTGLVVPAGPPVHVVETAVGRVGTDERERRRRVAGEILDPSAAGAVVRSPIGVTRVDPSGRFLVRAAVGDEIVVETDPPKIATVPEVGGVLLV
jgi:Pvc16 N-terminal domain